MKRFSISLLALLTAACGSNANQTVLADNSDYAGQSGGSGMVAERIAAAEAARGIRFEDMTPDEQTEILAARDSFGRIIRPSGEGRPISSDDRRAILRREREAGY